MQTTEMAYTRADPSVKLEALEASLRAAAAIGPLQSDGQADRVVDITLCNAESYAVEVTISRGLITRSA